MGRKYVAVSRVRFPDWKKALPDLVLDILEDVVARHSDVTLEMMQGSGHARPVVLARREFYRLMRTLRYPYEKIAAFVQKNHGGVINAMQKDPLWDYAAGKEKPPADLET